MEPDRLLVPRIIMILVAIFCCVRVIRSLFTGEILANGSGRFTRARRSGTPRYYWFNVLGYLGVAAGLLWIALVRK